MTSFARQGGSLGVPRTLAGKFGRVPWWLVVVLTLLTLFGAAVLFSATRNNPSEADLPIKHAIRFVPALIGMLLLALTPPRLWMRIAFPAYAATLVLLVLVAVMGDTGGGAKRWLVLGPVRLQPSEFMKLTLTLALAAYYHQMLKQKRRFEAKGKLTRFLLDMLVHVPALLLIAVPAVLIVSQPDLGTTLMLVSVGFAIMMFAGLNLWIIGGAIALQALAMLAVPHMLTPDQRDNPASGLGLGAIAYFFILDEYQRERVDVFLDPSGQDRDKVLQSEQARVAIGSGGITGKNYLEGTQSQGDFIPEQQTDFIFTNIAEEFGFVGSVVLLTVWGLLLGVSLVYAAAARDLFSKFAAGGAVVTIAFYVVFNIGMVIGLLPVVGIPLPLISYGGTAMATVMACFGLILSVRVHTPKT